MDVYPKSLPVYVLGPTAVGKTEIAIELACRVHGEIISADSMQLYAGMNIGTAKPAERERRGIPHHLFDVLQIHEHCDVVRFRNLAVAAIADIQSRGVTPIIVGGSGMYVRALTQGIFEGPGRDERIRDQLNNMSTTELRSRIESVDPSSAFKIGANDRKRMVRALEYQLLTGQPISQQQKEWKKQIAERSGDPKIFCLIREREQLYRRCDARVDEMFKSGFVEEVGSLIDAGLRNSPTASKAIGYSDVMRHVDGELSLEETILSVKKRTRNFVKRQISWFKTEPGIQWIDLTNTTQSEVISKIVSCLQI